MASLALGALGDGRGFVDNLQRQVLFSDMVTRLDDADLQPLSRSQGTVRMLARMARDVLPGVAGTGAERCRGNNCQPEPKSDAEARVFELLRAYAGGLDRRDMVEPCEAADIMAGALADNLPACTRAVFVRGITSFTHGLLDAAVCRGEQWGRGRQCCLPVSRRRARGAWPRHLMPAGVIV